MDTLSPQSVLDHRTRETPGTNVHLIPDRVTRTVSPGRLKSKSASSVTEEEEVELQISQPYRTSFSAITRPVRTKRDRSRSTSPAYSTTSKYEVRPQPLKKPRFPEIRPKTRDIRL
ncbi:hypothetical protein FSP39_008083 [Pinctada imbricata]|uniref:Uncharacterized protein n=1 Tax=Pinctada imbricata TaxID=66713 RepID=A0AA88YS99_PINIB|nr:hypothetical protein FSP39_008083 [Pinctada imbricata]